MTRRARQPLRIYGASRGGEACPSVFCHGASQIVYLRDQSNADSVRLSPLSFDMVTSIRTLAPATALLSRHPANDAKKSRFKC